MSWILKLAETYDKNLGALGYTADSLMPLYHEITDAFINVVLDEDGNLLRVEEVAYDDLKTVCPVTDESSGRTKAISPKPLIDNLSYLAGDYLKFCTLKEEKESKKESQVIPSAVAKKGKSKKEPKSKKEQAIERCLLHHSMYMEQLKKWCDYSNDKKLKSVYSYLKKGTLIGDIVANNIFTVKENGFLTPHRVMEKVKVNKGEKKPYNPWEKRVQEKVCVRFTVEIDGEIESCLWKDKDLWNKWIEYHESQPYDEIFCMALGEKSRITVNYPKHLRGSGDTTKIISQENKTGFVYLGRFTSGIEACTLSEKVTFKSHEALRWLIAKQGYNKGYDQQTLLAWATSGKSIPDITEDTYSMLFDGIDEDENPKVVYTAEETALALNQLIEGKSANIGSTDSVQILGLDAPSASSKGRLAMVLYRELTDSEFIDKIIAWHSPVNGCAWEQHLKGKTFIGAPSLYNIAEIAYGIYRNVKGQDVFDIPSGFVNRAIKRLLPCIIDDVSIPIDIVNACVKKACQRLVIKEQWMKEKALGVACAVYKFANKERNYSMEIEEERETRDYLYGRLLAIADMLESWCFNKKGISRETNASNLMDSFSQRPYSVWERLYKQKLAYVRSYFGAKANFYTDLIDEVTSKFQSGEFCSDKPLSGEFLLGYSCQKKKLKQRILELKNKNVEKKGIIENE